MYLFNKLTLQKVCKENDLGLIRFGFLGPEGTPL